MSEDNRYDFDDFVDHHFDEVASIYVEKENITSEEIINDNPNYFDYDDALEVDGYLTPEDLLADNALSDQVFYWAEDNQECVKFNWLKDWTDCPIVGCSDEIDKLWRKEIDKELEKEIEEENKIRMPIGNGVF